MSLVKVLSSAVASSVILSAAVGCQGRLFTYSRVEDVSTGRYYIAWGEFSGSYRGSITFRDEITKEKVTLDKFTYQEISDGAAKFYINGGTTPGRPSR